MKPQLFLLLAALLSVISGCESEKAKQARLADKKAKGQAIQQQIADYAIKAKGVKQRSSQLEKVIEGREKKWRDSVGARHPNWTPERREQQIAILDDKGHNSNRWRDEDTVREMRDFGWRGYALGGIPVDLVDADYWDIARAKSANWGTEDQIKELRKPLDSFESSMRSCERMLQNDGYR